MSRRRRAEVTVMVREAPGGRPLAMRVRRLWPDSNPLRRASDRAEFAVVVVLLAALLAGVPLTALAAARWSAASGMRPELAQAGRHQVAAVLLHDAPTTVGSLSLPGTGAASARAMAQPGGTAHREGRGAARCPGRQCRSGVARPVGQADRASGAG